MDFSFMSDSRWYGLDDQMKSRMVELSFESEAASNPGWSDLPMETQSKVKDLYTQEAMAYSKYLEPEPEKPGILKTVGKGLAGGTVGLAESVGTGVEYLGGRLDSETLKDVGQTTKKYWQEKGKKFEPSEQISGKNVWDNPELLANSEYWLYNVSSMVPALTATIVPGAGTYKWIKSATSIPKLAKLGASIVGGGFGGALEGSQTYNAVLEKGGTEEEAARSAELMTAGSGVLNALSVGKILSKAGTGFKSKVLKHMGAGAWEGITEGLEEPTEVFSKYFGSYLSGEELPTDLREQLISSAKDALTVAPIAAIAGASGSIIAPSETTIKDIGTAENVDDAISSFEETVGSDLDKAPEQFEDIAEQTEDYEAEILQQREYTDPQVINQARINAQPSDIEMVDRDVNQLNAEKGFVRRAVENNDFIPAEVARRHPDIISPEKIFDRKPRFKGEDLFIQKIDMMQSEVDNSQTKGVTQEDPTMEKEGGQIPFAVSSPMWMQQMNEDMKSFGLKILSRDQITTIFNKVKENKPLTDIQSGQYFFLEKAIEEYSGESGDFVAQEEADLLEKKGFELLGGQNVSVANLDEGDVFYGSVEGRKDEYTVKGSDKEGNVLLQDGIHVKVDMFDTVNIEGIKKVPEEKRVIQESIKSGKFVLPDQLKKYPDLVPEDKILKEKPESILDKKMYEVKFSDLNGRFKKEDHEKAVKDAVSSGKFVPYDVLKDYPDLVPEKDIIKKPSQDPKSVIDEFNKKYPGHSIKFDGIQEMPEIMKDRPNLINFTPQDGQVKKATMALDADKLTVENIKAKVDQKIKEFEKVAPQEESDVPSAKDRISANAANLALKELKKNESGVKRVADPLSVAANIKKHTGVEVDANEDSGTISLKTEKESSVKKTFKTPKKLGEEDALYQSEKRDESISDRRRKHKQRLERELAPYGESGSIRVLSRNEGQQKSFTEIGKAFGTTITLYDSKDIGINKITGFMIPGTDLIYINSGTRYPVMSIIGHETVHHLKRNYPELYEELKSEIGPNTKDFEKYFSSLLKAREQAGTGILTEEGAWEEFIGDFAGDRFQTPEFWAKLNEENPTLANRLVQTIKKIITKIKRAVRSEKYIEDIEKAEDALVKAFGEYAKREDVKLQTDKAQQNLTTAENGRFETGKEVTFGYVHNKESATELFGIPDKESKFGRGFEPSGKYLTITDKPGPYAKEDPDKYEIGTLSFKNPLVIKNNNLEWKKELSDFYGGLTGKELSKALIKDGYDGVVTVENGHTSESVDLSSFDESKAMYQTAEDGNRLVAVHNLSEKNIIHADKMGGLPVPSIAITSPDVDEFTGFGEISLISEPSLIDPKSGSGSKVFNADAYSPIYPSVEFKPDDKNLLKAWDKLSDSSKALGNIVSSELDDGEIKRKGIEAFYDSSVVKHGYLKSIGKEPRIKYKPKPDVPFYLRKFKMPEHEMVKDKKFIEAVNKYYEDKIETAPENRKSFYSETYLNEDGEVFFRFVDEMARSVSTYHKPKEIDSYGMKIAVDKKLKTKKLKKDFESWVDENFSNAIDGDRIRAGFTYSGRTKYLPHDLDTVVRLMKKGLKDGEDFNYGVGSVRAVASKKFKSLSGIKKDRSKIVSAEKMKEVKQNIDDEFFQITEDLKPFYRFQADSFGYYDDASDAMKSFINRGVYGFNEYYEGVPEEQLKDVADFLQKLRNLPTEYFEAKIQRSVGLYESEYAVIPKKSDKKTKDVLTKHGLTIRLYDKKIKGDRSRVIGTLKKGVLFQTEEELTSKEAFKESTTPISEDDYKENRKETTFFKVQVVTNLKRFKTDLKKGLDKYLGAISTRLWNISPKLKSKLRKLSFDTDTKSSKDVLSVEPLLRKAKKEMSKGDLQDWDYARKNSDVEKINELIDKYDLKKEYADYRNTLESLREEALDVGLEVGYIEEYAPRILKDPRGFLEAIGKEGDWPVISRRINERAKELGMSVSEMTVDQKADLISNMLHGGNYGIGGVPKKRVFAKIPAKLNKFYMDSDSALMAHIYSMRKSIEARKFFGKVPDKIAVAKRRLNLANKKLSESRRADAPNEGRIQFYLDNIYEYQQIIDTYKYQRDYTDNISTYVLELVEKGEISAAHEQELIEILTARFHESGTRGIVQAYKNLSYIDTMGSVTSALTQIGDLAWSMYENGMVSTLKNAYKSAIGKSRITKQDVGVERIAQEFQDSGTLGNAVSTVFKLVGLEKMDTIGKEALLNSALEKYQKEAKSDPKGLKKKIEAIFGSDTDGVIEDLLNDDITENVKLLVYNRLLDFQPVALSEMPQKYLEAGNGRIFYMLKSFTLKQFDVYRNEVFKKLKSPDKKVKIEGMKNLVRLSMFFVLANAGADELKDFVLGRKTDLSDRTVDNILRLFGVSKFVTWKARTEGVGSAMAKQILPPFKFIDAATKDLIKAGDGKGLETLSSVPIVGKLAYWHMGRGTTKRSDLWSGRFSKEKRRLKKVQEKFEESKDKQSYLKKHRKDLSQTKKIKKVQSKLNKLKKRINELKSLEETTSIKKLIIELEGRRTEMMTKYLKGLKNR